MNRIQNKLFWAFFISIFLPTAVGINIGSLRLTLYRVILLAMFVSMFSLLSKLLSSGRFFPATLFVWFSLWAYLSIIVNHGVSFSIEPGGVLFIEVVGPVVFTCLFCNTPQKALKIVTALVSIIALTLLVVIPESLTSINWFLEIIGKVFGGSYHHVDQRMGLYRALGTFDHAILFGVVSSSAIGFAFFSQGLFKTFLVTLSSLTSLSSGTIASISTQYLFLVWNKMFAKNPNKWKILLTLFILFIFAIELISNRSAIKVLLHYLTFSAHTAYWRILIFQYGMDNVFQNPIFGIGFYDWIRPAWMHGSSMDNYWLVFAVRYGIPGFLLYASACIMTALRVYRNKSPDQLMFQLRRGWLVGFAGLVISGCTVHFWNNAFIYFNFYIGFGLAISNISSNQIHHLRSKNI